MTDTHIADPAGSVRLMASSAMWMEGAAIQQLQQVAKWPGMDAVVGYPDLSPAKGSPTGASFASKTHVFPSLIGTDQGCGIGLWRTGIPLRRLKLNRVAPRLAVLDTP